ncbi:MAG: hypothetical protein PHP32_02990 [Candidatus Izemoplasmatales bacterium]|nr:hypothetical protein [Candidatus Izemoplasmatales bacterium]
MDEGYFSQAVEDFGLVEHVDSIPRTSSSLMTTIEFTDTISLTTLRVFDESGHLYLANQNWSRLDHLPEGTYYIVFDVVNHVNVQYLFAQYVFILVIQ